MEVADTWYRLGETFGGEAQVSTTGTDERPVAGGGDRNGTNSGGALCVPLDVTGLDAQFAHLSNDCQSFRILSDTTDDARVNPKTNQQGCRIESGASQAPREACSRIVAAGLGKRREIQEEISVDITDDESKETFGQSASLGG